MSRKAARGLELAREKMQTAGVDPIAIEVFAHYYRLLALGETGMIPESAIEPIDMESLVDVEVDPDAAREALAGTVVIKLNGGLGTSMGMDRAKSLLCVRRGLSFLDIIARQILQLRDEYAVTLPVMFMNSFRTSADTMAALGRYADLAVPGLPLEFLQSKEPKLLADKLTPVTWQKKPELEWCPPGHGDIYTVLQSHGLIDTLLEQGYSRLFISNCDNLGAVVSPQVAGWFAQSGAPFAIEAVRRTASDKKGGHFARRKIDGRIVLRETAQTLDHDRAALADLDRHRFCSTNNLWVDLQALRDTLEARRGVLGLPMIRNVKPVDPTDPKSPEVIQIETAMGAAIELFEGARTIEVGRDRFVPVKTTNDLLVLRSDVYEISADHRLERATDVIPYVDLSTVYKNVAGFDAHFPAGVPSMRDAQSLVIEGDWTFGSGVRINGDVTLGCGRGRIEDGRVIEGANR